MRSSDSDTDLGWPGLKLSRPLTDSVADTDDIAQSLFRFLANYIATKTTSLSQVEIARLSTSEITRLISNLSETDINRLFNAGISEFVDGIFEPFLPFFKMFFAGCFGLILLKNAILIYQRWNNELPSSGCAIPRHAITPTTDAAAQERLEPSTTSRFLSRSYTTDVKGLKVIGEIYSRGTNRSFRQEVEQDQEGTSRANVPSTGSTVDDPESLP
ncbi:uncharacterized protein [Medicago truncatula]|uniref:uncharacterized protein isoform X1 n=1 Tax=Medicago truncatula TaxID=3880 RepID=UPI00196725B4|nr:uncharacterized protein LOC11408627 isoform X1 [Medicago truncatula]